MEPSPEAKAFDVKFNAMVEDIRIASLPMQKKSFECSVACFDSHKKDYKAVEGCIERCQRPAQEMSETVNREMRNLQTTIQSCHQTCISRYQSSYQESKGDAQTKIGKQIESCVNGCFTEYEPQIKEIGERVKRHVN
eukprot:Selendium_serpulae@DN5566_c0_g1_i3.p2